MPKRWNSSLRAQPWAQESKARYQAEAEQAEIFEGLLLLHGVDFWHNHDPRRSRAGWPDYAIFGAGWLAFVELKAVSPNTGRRGRLSAEQLRYQRVIEEAGAEWRVFCLPPDLGDANAWLREKTGREVELR